MVSSRNRSSTASESTTTPAKVPKAPLEEWTTKEKLCLASLAIKHGNAWNSVARNMQAFAEKDRPDGWSNQKTCAAQFDKLMNELGVDKRPKRNEPSDGSSGSVIYKKMVEKRVKELEESIVDLRKMWLGVKGDLDALENGTLSSDRSEELNLKLQPASTSTTTTTTTIITVPPLTTNTSSSSITTTPTATTTTAASTTTTPPSSSSSSSTTTITTATTPSGSKTPATRTSTGTAGDPEKPPTRALTRRESSRQNLEKTLAMLCKEVSEIKSINLMCKPSQETERELYDKVILKHMDISIIKKRLGGEVDDPYAVMNDLLLMFQNATMFYPPEHPTHKAAVELGAKLVPQWEKTLLDRFKSKH